MIKVEIERNINNQIISFSLNGHAGYDVEGKDIVCAAVSAVTNMALIGLAEKLGISLIFRKSEGGFLEVKIPEDTDENKMLKAQFLLETLVSEYLDIESSYGKYILVKER